jgi:membrane complex biogenesis BtpA family protein
MQSLPFPEDAVVGMVHLPALPGAPEFAGSRDDVLERARRDARALTEGGVDAVLVENFGDAPFYPDDVPKHVVADLTRAVTSVVDAVDVPVGVNVLRNDAVAAVSVAAATGASFCRVNVHVGAAVTDQGVIEGQAHETVRLRERLDADVAICADVGVKHAAPLGDRDVTAEAVDAVERGHADAIVVSGGATGARTDESDLTAVREAVGPDVPLLVGSGATADSIDGLLDVADGAIVGTALKEDGVTMNPVDRERVEAVVDAAKNE